MINNPLANKNINDKVQSSHKCKYCGKYVYSFGNICSRKECKKNRLKVI